MMKTLYHGSAQIIEKPQFGYGKAYNDYGLGFYCTNSLEMALSFGEIVRTVRRSPADAAAI